MGRQKRHATAADRQAAYRHRLRETTAVVDRQALDRLHQQLDDLQRAVTAARAAGDPVARTCDAASVETLLTKLTAHSRARAADLTPPPPASILQP